MFLPEDCLELIFKCLPASDVCHVASVCKEWAELAKRDSIWANRDVPGGKQAAGHLSCYVEVFPDLASCPRDLFRYALHGFYVDKQKAKVKVGNSDGSLTYYASLGGQSKARIVSVEKELCSMEVEYSQNSPFPFMMHLTELVPGGYGNNRFWYVGIGPLTCYLPPGTYSLGWQLTRDEYWESETAFENREGEREGFSERGGEIQLLTRFWSPAQQVVMADEKLIFNSKTVSLIPNWSEVEVAKLIVERRDDPLDGSDFGDLPYWANMVSGCKESSGLNETNVLNNEHLMKVDLYAEMRSIVNTNWGGGMYIDALILKQLAG